MREFDPTDFERGFGRGFIRFQELMRHRVHEILVVSSLYDSFILEEDGQLEEGLIHEFMGLNLSHLPRLTRVSSGRAALERARTDHFDLVITTKSLPDMDARELAQTARAEGVSAPFVLLIHDRSELERLTKHGELRDFDRTFLWQGDFRILLAIVKVIEDRLNVESDTKSVGVQTILVIEDNVRYSSSFLPLIYGELMRQTQKVLAEGMNAAHRIMRMRARPKILLSESFEDAWTDFETYHESVLGMISDIEFPRGGALDPRAGVTLARNVREVHPDIPILLQSSNPGHRRDAVKLGVSFAEKESPLLLEEVRRFLTEHMSFGDFVFRTRDGEEVARAHDLKTLEENVRAIPDESLVYHAERNHFSSWLKARTEFWLAHELRPRKVSDFPTVADLRRDIVESLSDFRHRQQRGMILDFSTGTYDPSTSFARIGGGSLGGKGRGLAFVSRLIEAYGLDDRFPGVRISVPPCVVLGTEVFDEFLAANDLLDFAVKSRDDAKIGERFLAGRMPAGATEALRSFLSEVHDPLAVRSSSLLEDSKHEPFAGIYGTRFLSNDALGVQPRLTVLLAAVKQVYASTYSRRAKAYTRATAFRIEEEKMAVIVQKLVGRRHGPRFYPDFSGVARSHNFYPSEPMKRSDGIASVALGLGVFVVEGGASLRFCPRFPRHVPQLFTVDDSQAFSQREFCALVPRASSSETAVHRFDLATAESDGTLGPLASTWSPDDDRIRDGIGSPGPRLITFAPVLKQDIFPLARILTLLLDLGRSSMSSEVEIEFAVNLAPRGGGLAEFGFLQLRPMVVEHEMAEVVSIGVAEERLLCESRQVLGNGVRKDLREIVTVDLSKFERNWTREVAREIGLFNHELMSEGKPYLLVGVGRWGSSDPWLGIPVEWEDIAGAGVIVESSFRDLRVTPSQGSHFFQNLATMQVGYFTVDGDKTGFVDWAWLSRQPALRARAFTRRIRLKKPLIVKMDGRVNHGVIVKPAGTDRP